MAVWFLIFLDQICPKWIKLDQIEISHQSKNVTIKSCHIYKQNKRQRLGSVREAGNFLVTNMSQDSSVYWSVIAAKLIRIWKWGERERNAIILVCHQQTAQVQIRMKYIKCQLSHKKSSWIEKETKRFAEFKNWLHALFPKKMI